MSSLDCKSEQELDSTPNLKCFPLDSTLETPISHPFRKVQSRAERLHELSLMLHDPETVPFAETASRRTSESNQRQYSRCPMRDERTSATLSINGRNIDCQLVELSIGGFGIVVAGSIKFTPGTLASLRAPGLNYVVRVTRQETRPEGTFVGLRQIEEVLDYRQHLSDEHSRTFGYLIAGVAGALIAAVSYNFMNG